MATRSISESMPGEPLPADIDRADLAMCAYMRQVSPSADEYRLALLDTATSLGQTLHTWEADANRHSDVCALAFLLNDTLRTQLDTPTREDLDQAKRMMRDYFREGLDGAEDLSTAALVSVRAMDEVLDKWEESHEDIAPDAKGRDQLVVLGVAPIYAMRQAFDDMARLVPAFAADEY